VNLVVALLLAWAVLSLPLGLAVAAVLRGPGRRVRIATGTPAAGSATPALGGPLVDVA
jgi:hypothetical protein